MRWRAVAEDLSLLEVDDRFGDLGGVVGDPLQVPRGVDQPKPGVDPIRVVDLLLSCFWTVRYSWSTC